MSEMRRRWPGPRLLPTVLVVAQLWVAQLWVARQARAQLVNGQPIQTSDYTIDLHQGPVLAGARVVGLSGAYAPIAEGVAGYQFNPAAVAHRVPWSQTWFDWDFDAGFTLPTSLTEFDFDNNGRDGFSNSTALFLNGGFGVQLGDAGIGVTADWQLYQVDGAEQTLNINIWRILLVGGYGFFDNELIAGLGVASNIVTVDRAVNLESSDNTERRIGSVIGPTFHAGVLWAPSYAPLRIGASARYGLPPSAQADARPTCNPPQCAIVDSDFIVDQGSAFERYLPRTIALPTEIYFGAAFQLFRPLNFGWHNPHDQRSLYFDALDRKLDAARAERKAQRDRQLAEAERDHKDVRALSTELDDREDTLQGDEDDRLDDAEEAERQLRLMPYKAMQREKLLLIAGARVTLPSENGVGLDSFLAGTTERSGERVTLQPHGAIETEVWPGYLVLRGGSYLEPSRFAGVAPRLHGTGGLDIRIPIEWSVFGVLDDDTTFRVGGAIDYSSTYFGWGVTAGIWR
jgi:hypothetical protein